MIANRLNGSEPDAGRWWSILARRVGLLEVVDDADQPVGKVCGIPARRRELRNREPDGDFSCLPERGVPAGLFRFSRAPESSFSPTTARRQPRSAEGSPGP